MNDDRRRFVVVYANDLAKLIQTVRFIRNGEEVDHNKFAHDIKPWVSNVNQEDVYVVPRCTGSWKTYAFGPAALNDLLEVPATAVYQRYQLTVRLVMWIKFYLIPFLTDCMDHWAEIINGTFADTTLDYDIDPKQQSLAKGDLPVDTGRHRPKTRVDAHKYQASIPQLCALSSSPSSSSPSTSSATVGTFSHYQQQHRSLVQRSDIEGQRMDYTDEYVQQYLTQAPATHTVVNELLSGKMLRIGRLSLYYDTLQESDPVCLQNNGRYSSRVREYHAYLNDLRIGHVKANSNVTLQTAQSSRLTMSGSKKKLPQIDSATNIKRMKYNNAQQWPSINTESSPTPESDDEQKTSAYTSDAEATDSDVWFSDEDTVTDIDSDSGSETAVDDYIQQHHTIVESGSPSSCDSTSSDSSIASDVTCKRMVAGSNMESDVNNTHRSGGSSVHPSRIPNLDSGCNTPTKPMDKHTADETNELNTRAITSNSRMFTFVT